MNPETQAAIERALLAMTPGGSEFVNDPMACLGFIEGRMSTMGKVAAERNALRKLLQRAVELFAFIVNGGGDGMRPDEWHSAVEEWLAQAEESVK